MKLAQTSRNGGLAYDFFGARSAPENLTTGIFRKNAAKGRPLKSRKNCSGHASKTLKACVSCIQLRTSKSVQCHTEPKKYENVSELTGKLLKRCLTIPL